MLMKTITDTLNYDFNVADGRGKIYFTQVRLGLQPSNSIC